MRVRFSPRVVGVAALAFLGACAPEPETAQQRETRAVAAAFLRTAHDTETFHNYRITTWFLARLGDSEKVNRIADWYRDPPAEWLEPLRQNVPPVHPVSEARMEPNPQGISDSAGQTSVGVFSVRKISWLSETTAMIDADVCGRFYVGWTMRFRVAREKGVWRVASTEQRGIN